MRTMGYAIAIAVILAIVCGCFDRSSPILPDEPSRTGLDFEPNWPLWHSVQNYIDYKNIDLSVLVNAGLIGPDEIAEINDAHYTIATTIEQDYSFYPPLPQQIIKYA